MVAPQVRGGPLPGSAHAPVAVVLIEDDPGDALLVEEFLVDSGLAATLTWCRTLTEAAEALTDGPECVLVDLNLPDSDGLAGVRWVLREAPEAAVLVLTGLDDEGTAMAAVAEGAQDYLVKGRVEGELLGRAIRYAIERKAAEASARELRESTLRAEENARLERGLLPRPLVADPRLRVVSRYEPGRQRALLGGDFYDVVQTPDGVVRALIGDVSGHGPDEAALGVGLRIAWRSLVLAGISDPAALCGHLETLCLAERLHDRVYATLCMLELGPPDPTGGYTARVTLAGHPAPLLVEESGVRASAVPPAMPVGLLPGIAVWRAHDVRVAPGGGLLLYTDGLTDCQTGPGDDRLGVDGLALLADRLERADPHRFVDELVERVNADDAGRNDDDLAVLYVDWRG
ncbi:SpoIIE family protein phosphatase [Longispora sp. NPDC051575]|uniref:PP2C family protein-serine/threonine phosphatase n=1 Tax=Longispora sp. NPDC051575 TaxID=3154943 RepID=UPI00343BE366